MGPSPSTIPPGSIAIREEEKQGEVLDQRSEAQSNFAHREDSRAQILHVLCNDVVEVMKVNHAVVVMGDDGEVVVVVVAEEGRVLMKIMAVHNGMITKKEMLEKSFFFSWQFCYFLSFLS